MTCITDAHEFLVKARNRLGEAFLAEVDEDDQHNIGLAMIHVRDALDVLERVEPQQQTDDVVRLETHATLEKRKWVYDVRTMSHNPVWSPTHSVWLAIAEDGASCLLRNGTAVFPGDKLRIGDSLHVIASMETHGPLFLKATFTQPGTSPQQTGGGANLPQPPAGAQE